MKKKSVTYKVVNVVSLNKGKEESKVIFVIISRVAQSLISVCMQKKIHLHTSLASDAQAPLRQNDPASKP